MTKHSKEYDRYMRSAEWEQKRNERLQLDDNKCVMCGRPQGTLKNGQPVIQCHHISYQHLGAEPMEDLLSVCAGCHKKLHKYYKRYRSWQDKMAAGGALG